ncbi:MAG: hypothetical protein FWE58_01445, partial [Methanobrevibacter sp.]|nr:hypothetical protein [Methanobrevibacter sp.]
MSMVVAAESNFNLENDTNLDSAIDISVDSDIDSNINSNIISDLNSSSTSNDNPKSANSTVANGQNSSTTPPNTIVSGKILNCDNDDPFKGATIYIKTLNGEILATTVSDGNGNYLASFYSLDTQFYVLATYPGHVYPSETINVIQYEGMNYGVANMRFGNLSLAILSSPTLVYGSNLTAGPNSTVVEIAITNNAATTATNVWANFTSSGLGANFILAPGQSSSQFLGNITPGQTVYAFFLVTLINPGTFTLNYTVSVSGDNTGSPIDTINGSITSASGISQNRNAINSITVSNTNPNVGDFITITVVSSTANSNFAWVN